MREPISSKITRLAELVCACDESRLCSKTAERTKEKEKRQPGLNSREREQSQHVIASHETLPCVSEPLSRSSRLLRRAHLLANLGQLSLSYHQSTLWLIYYLSSAQSRHGAPPSRFEPSGFRMSRFDEIGSQQLSRKQGGRNVYDLQ